MMRFKQWLTESLAGPGGGPEMSPPDIEGYHKEIARKGAGAFRTIRDEPPKAAKSPLARYLPIQKRRPGYPGL